MFFDSLNDSNIIISSIANDTNLLTNPKLGLIRGNMFNNEYKTYKKIEPKELNATNEQEQLLLKIYELCFAITDLGLYLDLHKENKDIYSIYKSYVQKYNEYLKIYEDKYNILFQDSTLKDNYTWPNKPWPFEMGGIKYV
jgi:spore coat protein JB